VEAREQNLLRSMFETSWRYYLWLAFLSGVLLLGLVAYIHQFRQGLVVTGLRDQVSWGLYITNFVFFIGISHAGTLISAILRVTDAGWRQPITRMAEAITVFALCIGAPMVIVDMGRPDRLLYIFRHGRIQSPIVWDVLSISTYLMGCVLYFFIPMIPDLALLAERPGIAPWRRWLYRKLALGWTGTQEQKRLLEKAISVMAIIIIPLAVSVHTVVSWIFAMTLRPGWDSSIFGPYFVIGAIYSGAAAVIVSMWVLRRIFRLEDYVRPLHFRNLGLLLLSFALLYLYFNINEYLTAGYKLEGMERQLISRLFVGEYAWAFWSVQAIGVFIPLLLMLTVLTWKRYQEFLVPGVVLASACVVVGAWAKRYLIIIPTLQTPFLPPREAAAVQYHPTWVEWSITAAAVAGFLMIYSLLLKLFPIVSLWETREAGHAEEEAPVAAPAHPSRWWAPSGFTALLLVGVLLAPTPASAAARPAAAKQPKPVALALEWKVLPQPEAPAPEPTAKSGERVYLYSGRLLDPFHMFSSASAEDEKPAPAIQVTAGLRDQSGAPISFKAVEFALRTSFGTLSFGSRPTNDQGQATLVIRDHRLGFYPVVASFRGDDDFAAVHQETAVDFGLRPAQALPRVGVLITPYATPAIGVPFLFFYGLMWVVFVYAFGYLILYRMRRAGVHRPSGHDSHEPPAPPPPPKPAVAGH